MPTLSGLLGATLSSEGHAPLVLTCPIPTPTEQAPEMRALGDPALEQLIGPSRTMLLSVIGAHPGQGTWELARHTGLAPASVSDHARILRTVGLIDVTRDGTRAAHNLSSLGEILLFRASGQA